MPHTGEDEGEPEGRWEVGGSTMIIVDGVGATDGATIDGAAAPL